MRKKYYHAATPETMEKIIADGVVKRDGTVACTSAKSHRTQRSSWQSEDTMKWQ